MSSAGSDAERGRIASPSAAAVTRKPCGSRNLRTSFAISASSSTIRNVRFDRQSSGYPVVCARRGRVTSIARNPPSRRFATLTSPPCARAIGARRRQPQADAPRALVARPLDAEERPEDVLHLALRNAGAFVFDPPPAVVSMEARTSARPPKRTALSTRLANSRFSASGRPWKTSRPWNANQRDGRRRQRRRKWSRAARRGPPAARIRSSLRRGRR